MPLYLRREQLALQYSIKVRVTTSNPAYEVTCTFHPRNGDLYDRKPDAIHFFGFHIRAPLVEICPDLSAVTSCTFPCNPPWKLCQPMVNFSLPKYKRD